MKITSKKLMANYPIKTISKYFKQTPLYNTKWWMIRLTDIYYPLKNEYLLSKKTAEALTVINPKTQKFYITPKIHTHKKKNPGRLVIDSINCHTSLCWPSPENSFLVTMDVKALYANVPNNECISAVKRKHDNYTKKTIVTKVISTFSALILTLSNFVFNSKFYLQIKGCAMGTTCAPYIRKHIHVRVQRKIHLFSH